ncbi:type III-A CRISPR-associated RAMP protein Csm3 [candidate division KSB1 bacterium]
MKLLKNKVIKGEIRLQTGLHIGGSAQSIEIGGMDNPIIRNPRNSEPYIPGSSLKGKMRSILEWKLNKISQSGNPHEWCDNDVCPICRIFGTSSDAAHMGPTRLLVRDATLSENDRENIKNGVPITEEKYENSINRITARANPRPLERVVPGVSFDFEMVYRIFDIDGDNGKTDEELFQTVLDGLRFIEQDSLGGYGSRGSGHVRFENLADEEGTAITLEK